MTGFSFFKESPMPTNCSAARQFTQGLRSASVGAKRVPLAHSTYKHSKSADLLRKSLLSHVWRVPSSKFLSCKHERILELGTLASQRRNEKKVIIAPVDSQATCVYIYKTRLVKTNNKF